MPLDAPPLPLPDLSSPEPVVDAFLRHQLGSATAVERAIHPADEMLTYAQRIHFQHWGHSRVAYLRSGLATYRTLSALLAWRFGSLQATPEILDFASGFGRATRFWVKDYPPERLWVSDIQPEANEFQAKHFGVRTRESSQDPKALEWPRSFAAVLVSSLFSHLPEESFAAWLECLWRAVAPGGLLIFSTHGASALPADEEMPASGFFFRAASESKQLDPGQYGSTWATPAWVEARLEETVGEAGSWHHLPRGLWHFQDLYLVVKESAVSFADLRLPRGPEGYLEVCQRPTPHCLRLAGWAVDHDSPQRPVTVRAYVNGVAVAEIQPSWPREDVAPPSPSDSSSDGPVQSGWELEIDSRDRPFSDHDLLLLEAVNAAGAQFVMQVSTVEGAALEMAALGQLQRVVRERDRSERRAAADRYDRHCLELRIAAMQGSFFWKLRNLWWSIRSRFGRPTPT